MLEQYFLDLDARMKELENSYADLKHGYEARVVNWRWSQGEYYRMRPFAWERGGDSGRGHLVEDRPAKPHQAFQYGFNEKDQIIVEQTFGIMETAWVESFFLYTDEYVECMLYNHQQLGSISRLYSDDGLAIYYIQCSRFQRYAETLQYEQGRVSQILIQDEDRQKPSLRKQMTDRFTYESEGKLANIERYSLINDMGDPATIFITAWPQLPAGKRRH